VREVVEWCGSGVTVREITRLRRLGVDQQDGDRDGRVSDERCLASSHDPATVRRLWSVLMHVAGSD
jgi:hypothetical protein